MAEPALTATETLAWLNKTSETWRALLEAHPEILQLPCTIAGTTSAGGLLQHIVAVELRYAERLAGLPATDYTEVRFDSAEALYATHLRAAELFEQQMAANDVDWSERIEFPTRSVGRVRASRKAVLFHAMLHGIRHYAQLATLVREHGFKPGWPLDYLPMDMEPVE